MTPIELLEYVVQVLDHNHIEYMVTGSVASSLQGEPRATHDLAVVVEVWPQDGPALLKSFPSPGRMGRLGSDRHGRNVQRYQLAEGDKVDFGILTPDELGQSRFSRRVEEAVFGIRLKVSRPEDTVLAKRWPQLSAGSEKAFDDALRVFEVRARRLDVTYINHWSQRLGVHNLWQRVQREAELPEGLALRQSMSQLKRGRILRLAA